jgi:hypothetical protein
MLPRSFFVNAQKLYNFLKDLMDLLNVFAYSSLSSEPSLLQLQEEHTL